MDVHDFVTPPFRHGIAVIALLGGIAASAFAAETSLGKFTLAGGEKRAITVESATPFRAGFANESPMEQIKRCRKSCIQISVTGDPYSAAAASVGTTIVVTPVNGKAEIVFENREAFPILISVFRQ